MTTAKLTWGELQSQGVRRCCAIFTSGKRCRRRAVEQFESSWCDKHGPIFNKRADFASKETRSPANLKSTGV